MNEVEIVEVIETVEVVEVVEEEVLETIDIHMENAIITHEDNQFAYTKENMTILQSFEGNMMRQNDRADQHKVALDSPVTQQLEVMKENQQMLNQRIQSKERLIEESAREISNLGDNLIIKDNEI